MRHTRGLIFFFIMVSLMLGSCATTKGSTSSSSVSISEGSSSSSSLPSSSSSSASSSSSSSSASSATGYQELPSDYFPSYVGSEKGKSNSKIALSSVPNEASFNDYEVYVDGVKAPLYQVKTASKHEFVASENPRNNSAVLIFRLEGIADVTIRLPFAITKATLRPLASALPLTIDEKRQLVSFSLYNVGQYTVEFNDTSLGVLHIFVESFKEDYAAMANESNVLYFGPGLHEASNDSRLANNQVTLQSNQIVVIDYGAVVRGRFYSSNSTNVKIIGGGVIDGSTFTRNASSNEATIPLDFSFCSNFTIEGVSFLDPAGWCLNLYYGDTFKVNDVKIITSRANGDGISLQSCKNGTISNSFVRSFDDSLVVKNYPRYGNYSLEGSTNHLHFSSMLVWTDLAQSMEIGYETIGEMMNDITFTDITVLHAYHNAPISIHNANNAKITNVEFKNITVEDPAMGSGNGRNQLINLSVAYSSTWSSNWKETTLGSIDGVKIINVLSLTNRSKQPIDILGSLDSRDKSTHYISNVLLQDITIAGNKVDALYKYYSVNNYAKSVYFANSSTPSSGANLVYEHTLEEISATYSRFTSLSA